MNTMKRFYASIASASRLQGPYLDALSEITGINRRQTKALLTDMGWQDWSGEFPTSLTWRKSRFPTRRRLIPLSQPLLPPYKNSSKLWVSLPRL